MVNIYLSDHMLCNCFLFLLFVIFYLIVHMYVCVCVYIYIYVCVCVCVCIGVLFTPYSIGMCDIKQVLYITQFHTGT